MRAAESREAAGGVSLQVGVLGPLDVRVDGRLVAVPTGRLQALLAVLAMSAGRAVPADRLASAVWGDEQPDHARRSVQLYVTRLRRVLGAATIRTRPDGYLLAADQVDALRFQRLLDTAAAAPDDGATRACLVAALALWRGAPFDGVRAAWLDRVEGPRLLDLYLGAVERRIDLDLAAGADGEVLGQLRELTARHPLRERFWEQLMTALYRTGRQAEALDAYRRLYRVLADELGVAPGAGVRELHRRILAGDPGLRAPAGRHGASRVPVPRQLPPAIRGFSGRDAALAALDAVADRAGTAAATAVVSGGGGVGKTSLVVHWAHRAAGRFPDGQLYVDLCGFGPSGAGTRPEMGGRPGPALRPADAIRGFLEALGTAPAAVPTELPARIGLYRSLMSGKRMLVLLDNAADAEQVRPLLPGAAGSVAVVTSRHQLPGLVAEGACPVTLDVLPAGEARALLAARIGGRRVDAEPEAADRIVAMCAGLPLAIAIVAARATTAPRHGLAALAAELGEFRTCLDALASADAATDPRAVFSWSYARLSPAAQRLFRLLSLHPGREVGALAAASLAGLPGPAVRPALAELCRAHLLTEPAPGRYARHDLLRAYAAELLDGHDGAAHQRAARRRLLDHLLGTAAAAARLVAPLREPIALVPAAPGVTLEPFGGREDALAWLAAERPALLRAVDLAAGDGLDAHAWQLAWALAGFLHWRGRWHERVATLRTALAAAERLGDRAEQARAHRCLGLAYTRLERYEDAHAHLRQALKLYLRSGDPAGQVRTHQSLATVLERQGEPHAALRHAERAIALYTPAGSPAELGRLLNSAGWCHARAGDLRQALAHCERAAALAREACDPAAEAATWDSLGYIRHRLGEHGQALAAYRRALDLRRTIGHRCGEAGTLARIGDTQDAIGDRTAARAAWRDALAILDDLGEPGADAVRARLATA